VFFVPCCGTSLHALVFVEPESEKQSPRQPAPRSHDDNTSQTTDRYRESEFKIVETRNPINVKKKADKS